MTPEAALLLPSGRELDEWIALNVLGWERIDDDWRELRGHSPENEKMIYGAVSVPRFSKYPSGAFDLAEHLTARGLLLSLRHTGRPIGKWMARFIERDSAADPEFALAETPALAICRAAIRVYQLGNQNKGPTQT